MSTVNLSQPSTINFTTSTNPADREIDALRARVETLGAAMREIIETKISTEYAESWQDWSRILFDVYSIASAVLTPAPEPAPKAETETAITHEEFDALWRKCATNDATVNEIRAYRAECDRRVAMLSDSRTAGKDEREGRKK